MSADRPQSHHERHGLHRRGGGGFPQLERAHPVRERLRRRGARRTGLQHLLRRQVAPVPRGRDATWLRPGAAGRSGAASSGSTASSAARPTSGIPTWSTTTSPVEQPATPGGGLPPLARTSPTRRSAFIRDAKVIAPDKPFFMYFCPGAGHAPHHAPKEWADKYKGKFDMGYEATASWHPRAPEEARAPARGHRALADQPATATATSADGEPWPELDTVRPWDSLSDDEKRLFARMAEVFAGFVSLHRRPDRSAARLPRGVRPARQHDHRGRLRQRRQRRGRPERLGQREQVLQRRARHDRGEPAVPRRARHAAAPTTTTPPGGRGRSTRRSRCGSATRLRGWHRRPDDRVAGRSGSRPRACAASTSTRSTSCRRSTSASASSRPRTLKGYTQSPIEGDELRGDASTTPTATTGKETQFYAMLRHPRDLARRLEGRSRPRRRRPTPGATSRSQLGAVRHRRSTRASATTSPSSTPSKLQELIALWWAAGGQVQRAAARGPRRHRDPDDSERPQIGKPRDRYVYYPDAPRCPRRSPSTSATAPTRSPPRSTSTPPTPGRAVLARARGSAATRSTSRTASSSTSTTGSASSSRSSSRPSRSRPGTSSVRVVRARRRRHAGRGHAHAVHRRRARSARAGSRPSPGSSRIAGEGLNIGKDTAEPVTDDYPGELAVAIRRRHDQRR